MPSGRNAGLWLKAGRRRRRLIMKKHSAISFTLSINYTHKPKQVQAFILHLLVYNQIGIPSNRCTKLGGFISCVSYQAYACKEEYCAQQAI